MSSSSCEFTRLWGECSRDCLHRSEIYRLEHIGIYYVRFYFKHWCIYLYTLCEVHGNQIWTVEKEIKGRHAKADYQYFWNNHIFMWCSYYDKYLCVEKFRPISYQPLLSAYNLVMNWSENGYY